ncbi:tetratricopeptide repeat protein [Rhodococcus qingshengii]|uniref:tetratricopeptide repeat protein n=1 Tax=Rhodococcus qingshengii TaxID=334542 RepID=UPI00237C6F79|nr:tetratricopeptide repeat protein [Rhodococcus qingshengii]WCT05904.1 tetratricopeptide repeat protein [Rhodococcus qingshengii]
MKPPNELPEDVETAIARGYAERDRSNMAPTIELFLQLLDLHPGHPTLLYEAGGAYDTAGEGAVAEEYYRRALDGGLDGDRHRRCLLQLGSTLRNLERFEESIAVLEQARVAYPHSDALRVFHALSLHAAGKTDAALAESLWLIADRIDSDDIRRYHAALMGNANHLASTNR